MGESVPTFRHVILSEGRSPKSKDLRTEMIANVSVRA